ncbi:hypothetical protein [Glaciihabitans sp. UYNi722]|uniref:hypothetical protein n=1 Tax=Glaciihabitans sp. UYNi722 TaxID=3156344 RepID=UPI003392CAC1
MATIGGSRVQDARAMVEASDLEGCRQPLERLLASVGPWSRARYGRSRRGIGDDVGMTATSEDQPETHWHKRGSRTVYRGRSIISEHDVVLPTGQHATYEVDESVPFAAAVLIVDENDMLCLARQYRYPLERWI